MSNEIYEKLEICRKSILQKTNFKPEVAVILGSGLGEYASKIKIEQIIPYTEIEGFPVSTVVGHKGQFVFGYVKEVPVVIMQGRVHYYEGYPVTDVVLPVRLMGMLGAKKLILTNASGGINTGFHPGDLMLITDQIMSGIPNPLIGANIEELGTRFPDMTRAYDREFIGLVEEIAASHGISLKKGVYVGLTGPSFETPAEYAFYGRVGGDAIGMSTVPEVIVARHAGLRVFGMSVITNEGYHFADDFVNDGADVIVAANQAAAVMTILFRELVAKI